MFAGFDTSNYTTSAAVLCDGEICQSKKMLSVKEGERGLRQSDAVFQHTVNMPWVMEALSFDNLEAVGVSVRPRNAEGSYMPCFLVGEGIAAAVAKTAGVPLYKTAHQVGHILAALYSCEMLSLCQTPFLAFHLSGGTTEALLVRPHEEEIIRADLVASSLDLKAGQAIDRTGVMLGLNFPCGKALDVLSQQCDETYRVHPSMKGLDCSLSGVENKAKQMMDSGAPQENIAKFVLTYITQTVDTMTAALLSEYGNLPLVFSGGVASNTMLRNRIQTKYGAHFATPAFSLDNAAGVAVYAAMKHHHGVWQF